MAKYRNAKQIAKSAKKEISDSKLHKYLIAIPLIALFIKFITMTNIPGGGWYGAYGENYANGVDALVADGFFSSEGTLNYWPAGYPLLMWPLAAITITKFYYLLSIIQSIFFAYSTYFLTNKLRNSTLKYLAFWVSVIISFNPTLSLSTLSTGYEAPIASCFMMIAGLILANFDKPADKKFWIAVASVGSWFALAAFMQPRYLLVGLLVIVAWVLKAVGRRNQIKIAGLAIAVMMISPTVLIYRNSVAIDQATISTNLGVTMRIGAGPETSGGYERSGPEVPCNPTPPATSVTDNEIVVCVIKWYVTNPLDTGRLVFNKARFFWSPWSGSEVQGTMARNPCLKISPVHQITIGSQAGRDFVYSPFGIVVSHLWVAAQILLLLIGYRSLRRLGSDQKFFANIVLVPVVVSWLISIGTIGDHRFRIPTMGLSLILQVAGFLTLRKKLNEKVG